ncbi:MAG: inositol monophosphatase [Dictyoglomaceae bacterium]|nr:inositol monophosphatase [Dictyoglomaceae bacterium]
MKEILNIAENIVKEAGKILLKYFYEEKDIKLKSISNLITKGDRLSEEKIIELISKNFPNHSILSEEKGDIKKESNYQWIIDPLDGTTNYAHNNPYFSISIALKRENNIILGIIYDPIREELFSAIKGKGAFLNRERIKVSEVKDLKDSLLAFGLPYELTMDEKNFISFINLSRRSHGIRRIGSAALELAYVSCGRLDGYWSKRLNPWDFSAGLLLVEEAGGKVTDFNNNIVPFKETSIVASNGLIHSRLLEILKLEVISI